MQASKVTFLGAPVNMVVMRLATGSPINPGSHLHHPEGSVAAQDKVPHVQVDASR